VSFEKALFFILLGENKKKNKFGINNKGLSMLERKQ
jgi:hypothetical protein